MCPGEMEYITCVLLLVFPMNTINDAIWGPFVSQFAHYNHSLVRATGR